MKSSSAEQTPRVAAVYQILAEDIKALGIDAVFGLISDDICQLVATLDGLGVRFYGVRHETNAIMMAEGYASTTGRLGIAMIGRGPAMANGMHGLMAAGKSGSRVLVIAGEAPLASRAPNALGPDLKSFAAAQVVAAAGLPVFAATSVDVARSALADAVAEAELGKAVTLLLPMDVQVASVEVMPTRAGPLAPKAAKPSPSARAPSLAAAVELLSKSRRPLIIGGVGAHRARARQAIEDLAARIGALLVTSLKAKDLFRGNPYDLGIIGSSSHSAARRYIEQADCVLVLGASLNYLTMVSGHALPQVPIIQVDSVRTNIGRWWFADVGIVGDARSVAEQLLDALPERAAADKPIHTDEVRQRLAAFKHTDDFDPAHTRHTVDPRSLSLELDQLLPQRRNVVWDGGNFMANWAYISVPDPGYLKITLDFGSVGLGLGTALGVARARPDCPTLLFIGDGGLLMSMGELETVIREDLPLVIVVMNDAAYGAEEHILRAQDLPVARARFADLDFAPIAATMGYETATVRSLDQLRQIAPLLANPEGPILLDCKINGAVIAPFISEFVHRK